MPRSSQPSLRQLADQLHLSVATVSMALRQDPRIRPETAQRVKVLAERVGYHSDPVVSEGLSRIRKGVFYRETLAWCFDEDPKNLYWLKTLFQSTEDYGRRMGYKLEYCFFANGETRTLKRMAEIWKARGIRGVLLGPFRHTRANLPFPWQDFVWVSIDGAVTQPAIHQVGRDYERDIAHGLGLLTQRGCSRPGFVVEDQQVKAFREPLLRAALAFYHRSPNPPPEPYVETSTPHPRHFAGWLKQNRPDCIVVSRAMAPAFISLAPDLPMVILSEYLPCRPLEISFGANYETMGQSAVNFMHRMLATRQIGIPECEQSVLISSHVQFHPRPGPPPPPPALQ